jgi:hypothetical protein
MPLATLSLTNCKGLKDMAPIAELKLTSLKLPPQEVVGIDALRKMTSLATINGMQAETFWSKRDKLNKK